MCLHDHLKLTNGHKHYELVSKCICVYLYGPLFYTVVFGNARESNYISINEISDNIWP